MEESIPISVVILTKNEASRIRDCIESVRWADDVVVVDDESIDETTTIAESLGARVLRRKMDVEGIHRNWANAQGKHEWVLSLDADERVTPELAEELKELFSGIPPFETYAIPRRNFIGKTWVRFGGWYPSAQLKLFKESVFKWEEASVHPRAFSDKPCGILRNDLLHYSYRDIGDFVDKMNRQTTLESEKWVNDGRNVNFMKAFRRAVDRFFRAYLMKQGYRDGLLGFFVAWFASAYQIISYAKYQEARKAIDDGGAKEVHSTSAQTTARP